MDEAAHRAALPLAQREEPESLAAFTFAKFAGAYFQSGTRSEFERRLLKRPLLNIPVLSIA